MCRNGENITDPLDISNSLNTFFVSIGQTNHTMTSEDHGNVPRASKPNSTPSLQLNQFKQTTKKELKQIFKLLPPKNSSGLDEISNTIIKHCKDELITSLLDKINTSIRQATVRQFHKP